MILTAGSVFDGQRLHRDLAVVVADGRVKELRPLQDCSDVQNLGAGILAPGFVDVQVNGGGGVMFNDAPCVDTLRRMATAHAGLGATTILPTLITDTREVTLAAIEAAISACASVPGIAGLHLEGPHLSVARKGAHAASHIRPMEDADLVLYGDAVRRLPKLKLTLAPESVRPDQVSQLVKAGVLVSLGHSDASFEACKDLINAGATCVTHLFNAMSQLTGRAPGLVGAALSHGGVSAGLIADTIHVAPASIRLAMQAKTGPGQIFLVSDAMAVAGSDLTEFELNGRTITRQDGRLTLGDGTLAGADLDLAQAIRVIVREVGISTERALAMATSVPAGLIGAQAGRGHLKAGGQADMVLLTENLMLQQVWLGGQLVPSASNHTANRRLP